MPWGCAARSARGEVLAEPGGEGCLVEVPAGEGEDGGYDLALRSVNAESVQAEEEVHGLEGDALVAVAERVVSGEAEPIGSSEGKEVGLGVVGEEVTGTVEGRFEERTIAKAYGATVSLDLVCVDGEYMSDSQPSRLGHLASSRMAFR